jgi:hypothetical protein
VITSGDNGASNQPVTNYNHEEFRPELPGVTAYGLTAWCTVTARRRISRISITLSRCSVVKLRNVARSVSLSIAGLIVISAFERAGFTVGFLIAINERIEPFV